MSSALQYAVNRAKRELGEMADTLKLIERAQQLLAEQPTSRQLEVLQLIATTQATKGYAPTFKEIAAGLCITSTHAVACHLEPLRKRGLVTWVPKKARTLALTIGTNVRVHAPKYSTHGRTGVVTDDACGFPWRDHRRVQFDLVPGKVKGELVPVNELVEIKLSERPAGALPPEKRQLGLFGEAA